jgi:hypothetical protein
MWGTIFWMYYSLEDKDIFTCEKLFSECTTLWGHTYIYMTQIIVPHM